jgi:hypothetical protein
VTRLTDGGSGGPLPSSYIYAIVLRFCRIECR